MKCVKNITTRETRGKKVQSYSKRQAFISKNSNKKKKHFYQMTERASNLQLILVQTGGTRRGRTAVNKRA